MLQVAPGRIIGRIFLPLFLVLGGVTGCASGLQFGPEVSPAEIPDLEARVATTPQAVPVLVRLGRAYRAAERPDDAVVVLERAIQVAPTDPAAVAFLGLAYEDLERPSDARTLYQRYQQVGDSDALLRWIDGRLPALRRQELRQEAREAVRQEERLAATPPRPRHVAVFPFLYSGADPRYEPLSRALAELLITDLSQTDRITILERLRVQLLLDEMAMAGGVVDPATAARSGRLLGAEYAVLGSLDASDAEVSLEAAVVRVAQATREGAPISERDGLRQLFEAQKRLALDIYRGLGIELTPAERDRVLQQRTGSVEALLAFGRGLAAEDRGDFSAAAAEFRQAAAADPGFSEAQARAATADVVAEAEAEVPVEVAGGVEDTGSLDDLATLIPDALVRDAVAEATGQEGFGRGAVLEILIRRP